MGKDEIVDEKLVKSHEMRFWQRKIDWEKALMGGCVSCWELEYSWRVNVGIKSWPYIWKRSN